MTAAERVSTWAGPMVVKELRQGLRARVFGVFFGLLLVVCVLIATLAMSKPNRSDGGRFVLTLDLLVLAVLGFLVVPFTAFRSLWKEREDETFALVLLTGLSSRAIVFGKWLSAMTQAGLYLSACAPFVLFTYFLNGVSLPQLGLSLATVVGWTSLCTALAVALGSQTGSRVLRAGTQVVVLVVLGFLFIVGMWLAGTFANQELTAARGHWPLALGGLLAVALGTSWLALEGAAVALSLPTESAWRRPRLALTLSTLAWVALATAVTLTFRPDDMACVLCTIGTSLYLVLAGLFFIGEPDGYLPRFRGAGLGRPGAARSLLMVLGLLLVSGVAFGLLGIDFLAGSYHTVYLAAPAYPVLYLSLAAVLARGTALGRLGQPTASRVAFAALCLLGIAVSPLVGQLAWNTLDVRLVNALNPAMGLIYELDHRDHTFADSPHVWLLAACTGLAALGATFALHAFDRERPA